MVGEQPCQCAAFSINAQPSAASAVAMPKPIPLVEPVTIEVLPLSIILLLISLPGRCPTCCRRITPQADRGSAAKWSRASPLTDDDVAQNVGHIVQRFLAGIGVGTGIAPGCGEAAVDMSGTQR